MKNRRVWIWVTLLNLPLWGTGFAMRASDGVEASALNDGLSAYRDGRASESLVSFDEACDSGEALGCINAGHLYEYG